jgi:hypothetical protein
VTKPLHAITTPALLTALGHGFPLRLHFNEPRDCPELWINVKARNHWTVEGRRHLPADQTFLRAVISGRLVGGRFERTKIAQYYDLVQPGPSGSTVAIVLYDDAPPPTAESFHVPDAPGPAGHVVTGGEVKFPGVVGKIHYLIIEHDGAESRVPLQRYEPDKAIAPWEIHLEVFAKVDGELEVQTLPLISVQTLDTARAEVAFIAATATDFPLNPETKPFPARAAQYWRAKADNQNLTEPHLASILTLLIDFDPARRLNEPFGAVNIVSHGNRDTWWIRRTKQDHLWPAGFAAKEVVQRYGRLLGSFVPNPKTTLSSSPGLTAPPLSVVDGDTNVILRGCDLGNSQALLDDVRKQFGGQATVFAPRYEMVYRTVEGLPSEVLFEAWQFYRPGKHNWPQSDSELATLLASWYEASKDDAPALAREKELYASFSSDDWARVAAIHSTDPAGNSLRHKVDHEEVPLSYSTDDKEEVFDSAGNQHSKTKLVALVSKSTPGYLDLENHFEISDPEVVSSATSPKFRVSVVASRTRFKLVRLLTVGGKGEGPAVTPDLRNPMHFGKSPA